jgi:hypothetical protein
MELQRQTYGTREGKGRGLQLRGQKNGSAETVETVRRPGFSGVYLGRLGKSLEDRTSKPAN